MGSAKIDGLYIEVNKDDLERAFSKFGPIGDVYVPQDRDHNAQPGDNRGFGFVRFVNQDDMYDAIDETDGKTIANVGKNLRVEKAGTKMYGPPSGGRDDRRDDRRSGGGGRIYDDRRRSPSVEKKRRERSYSRSPRR